MSEIDPSGIQQPIEQPTIEEESPELSYDPALYTYFLSTLAPSDLQEDFAAILSSNPQLPHPIAMLLVENEGEVVNKMLDHWLDHLAETAERIREEQNRIEADGGSSRPLRGTSEYQEWVDSLPGGLRDRELALNRAEDLNHALVGYAGGIEKPEVEDVVLIGAGMTALMTMGVVGPEYTDILGVQPIRDGVAQGVGILPQELQDYATLTINLFVVGALYSQVVDTVKGVASNEPPGTTLDAARDIGEKILAKVTDSNNPISGFLHSLLIGQSEKGTPLSNERLAELVRIAKIMMLSVALALIYKVETGGLSEGEFAGMLSGEMKLDPEGVRAKLLNTINGLLSELPPTEREAIVGALLAFASSSPQVADLLHPQKAYALIAQQMPHYGGSRA